VTAAALLLAAYLATQTWGWEPVAVCDRRAEKFHAIESKIPKDVRTWMLGLIPAKRKEG
jgi:hypothetical protein